MKSSELRIIVNHEPFRPYSEDELFDASDGVAANEPFDKSFLEICDMLHHIDDAAASNAFNKDFSDIRELRSQLRNGLVRGLVWMAVGMCLISASFVVFAQ